MFIHQLPHRIRYPIQLCCRWRFFPAVESGFRVSYALHSCFLLRKSTDIFSPPQSQGCSKAAIQVTALNALLDTSHQNGRRSSHLPNNFSQIFSKRSAEYLGPVW